MNKGLRSVMQMVEMRRKDREITELDRKLGVVEKCRVCRIGMKDEYGLYIVPMNFGYEYKDEKLVLYFHCAKQGRKIDALKYDPEVCIEMDCDHEVYVENEEIACTYAYRFLSIIGNGKAEFIEDDSEKEHALNMLMLHQVGRTFPFDPRMFQAVNVFRVVVDHFTGKEHE